MDFYTGRLKKEDIPEAARLEKTVFGEPWSEESLKESMENSCYYFAGVYCGAQLAGYAGSYITGDELNITNVAVFPEWQHKGAGSLLLKALDKLAEERKLYGITLEVRASNSKALKLYEKCGYQSAGIRKGFYENPTEDAVIMWKYFQQ